MGDDGDQHGGGPSASRAHQPRPLVKSFAPWPVAVAAVVGLSSAAAAQDVDDGAQHEQVFRLDVLDAYVDLRGEYDRASVETDSNRSAFSFVKGRKQTDEHRGFEESLGLRFDGDLLDPGVLAFVGDVAFGLAQDFYREKTDAYSDSDNEDGHVLRYALRANLFAGKPISGTVHGLRDDDRINRRFQPTLRQERTGFGTNWLFAHDKIPMELSYDYLETDRTGNRDGRDDEHYTESNLHYGATWNASKHQRLQFSYDHGSNSQEYQGLNRPYETDRDLIRLDHRLAFGDHHQHELETVVRWQEESGDFARDLFEIGPQLTLHHSDDLQTMYEYQFNRERYDGLDIESQRADWQLVHQLFTNLTTTAGLFGLYEDIEDDVNTTQYGASIDWQYNRRNPYGHLYSNLGLAYDTEHVRGDNGRRLIWSESHTFRDPLPVTLAQRNVIPWTVVVTDTSNRRVFVAGLDYALFRIGNVTQLHRLWTGRIADRDSVLVHYQIDTPADGRIDTERVDYGIEQRFSNGLTPYYRFSFRNQEDDASTGFARRADRTDHHRIGLTYARDRYTLGAEYEVFDDTIDPYHAWHLDARLDLLDGKAAAGHALQWATRFSRFHFEGGPDRRDVTFLDAELSHRCQLSEAWSTQTRFGYRLEDDSVDGITNGWDVVSGMAYAIGDLSCELTVEYHRLDLPRSQEDEVGVYLNVRRVFPDVLGRAEK